MNKIKTQMFIVVGILTYSILPAELVELTNYEMSVIKGGAVSVNSCGEGVSYWNCFTLGILLSRLLLG